MLLVQIDGLSMPQLRRAMDEGRMPFLKRLERAEGYRVLTMYSGLPSTTAAAQAELFYGVKTAVPAYGFKANTEDLMEMTDWDAARRVEEKLAERGAPLLAGGSVYSSIYTGGAAESYFCAMSVRRGWDKPLFFTRWLLMHLFRRPPQALAVVARTLWELVPGLLAVPDGYFKGMEVRQEFYFAFKRMACVWLREVGVLGARRDMAKGVPVICVNLVGYDEAAHRRGPSAIYARRFLKSIDGAVRRLHKSARRRGYDLWLFSDHGQEDATPYVKARDMTLPEIVRELVQRHRAEAEDDWPAPDLFSIDVKERTMNLLGVGENALRDADLWVISMGPLAHVYLPKDMAPERTRSLARDLVRRAGVPLVLMAEGPDRARAYLPEGEFTLPDDARAVLGPHPFAEDLVQDVLGLCRHPDAGQLVLSGWSKSGPPMTLALEHGAHGSLGPNETSAFLFLPKRVEIRPSTKGGIYFRPVDLRRAAQRFLGRT